MALLSAPIWPLISPSPTDVNSSWHVTLFSTEIPWVININTDPIRPGELKQWQLWCCLYKTPQWILNKVVEVYKFHRNIKCSILARTIVHLSSNLLDADLCASFLHTICLSFTCGCPASTRCHKSTASTFTMAAWKLWLPSVQTKQGLMDSRLTLIKIFKIFQWYLLVPIQSQCLVKWWLSCQVWKRQYSIHFMHKIHNCMPCNSKLIYFKGMYLLKYVVWHDDSRIIIQSLPTHNIFSKAWETA